MPTKTATAVAPAAVEQQAPADTGVHIGDASIEVNIRPIEPRGALIGLADVKINVLGGAVTIPDFKVFNGESGLFVKEPSRWDKPAGKYVPTARMKGDEIKNLLNEVVHEAWDNKIKQIQARTAAMAGIELKPARIADQLEKAGQEAAKANAARPVDRTERTPPPAHDGRE